MTPRPLLGSPFPSCLPCPSSPVTPPFSSLPKMRLSNSTRRNARPPPLRPLPPALITARHNLSPETLDLCPPHSPPALPPPPQRRATRKLLPPRLTTGKKLTRKLGSTSKRGSRVGIPCGFTSRTMRLDGTRRTRAGLVITTPRTSLIPRCCPTIASSSPAAGQTHRTSFRQLSSTRDRASRTSSSTFEGVCRGSCPTGDKGRARASRGNLRCWITQESALPGICR